MHSRTVIQLLALSLPSLGSSAADEPWSLDKPLNGVSFKLAKAVTDPTPDRPATRVSKIVGLKGHDGHRSLVSTLGQVLRTPPTHGQHSYQNISSAGSFSTQYAIECGWDGNPVWLLIDTGSSDTWAVQKGFECRDGRGRHHKEETCGFGSTRLKDFGGGVIDELHFHIKYGSGERIIGPMGRSDVICGGASVVGQQVGLANYTFWHGNNKTVGILGLAYPSITSAFYGPIGAEAPWNAMTYPPFLTSAVAQGSMDPLFSVAILKNSSDGMIAWGGLPPVALRKGSYAATDLVIVSHICICKVLLGC